MTLTQAAVWTKRGMLGTVVSIVLITAAVTGSRMWYQYQLANRPPVEEKPEMKFGTLPEIQFPLVQVTSSNFSYTIDTVTGGLPQFPKLVKVYFIPQTSISLLSSEKAQKLAESLGFSGSPEVLSPTRYKFTDGKDGTVAIDLTTGNFHIVRKIPETDSESPQAEPPPLPGKEQLIAEFKLYLS